ncbi:MAG: peptidoglycan DD-metalloendopeptidase family protein [Alphaproteobacteria bacterium]
MRMSLRVLFCLSLSLLLTSCLGMGARAPAPVVHHGQKSGAGSAGVHNVVAGDTLYSISQRYKIPMHDIAVLNRVQPPFKLYQGQRLKLPPPQEYRVRAGDTLYGVSRLFGVQSSQVARLNNIRAPYTLRVGQVLRLPSVARQKTQVAEKRPSVEVASVEREGVAPTPQGKPLASQEGVVTPPKKPQNSIVKDGVPVPQGKPQPRKITKVSKVKTKAPKRSSSKFLRPLRGRTLSNYGAKKSGLHNDGINIAAARGTPVKAAENGVVVYTGNALKGSGNLVLVRHDNRWMTAYGHLDKITVKKGQVLKRGSVLGNVGTSGSVSTPQLHFEIRRGTSALNPVKYME